VTRAALIVILCLASLPAVARDDGRHAGDPLKPWFDELRDKTGQECCADADGTIVKDVDWTAVGVERCRHTPALSLSEEDVDYEGRYCVRYKNVWWLVPDRAVLDQPNRFGPAIIWPFCKSPSHVTSASVCADEDSTLFFIRCFIPGAGA